MSTLNLSALVVDDDVMVRNLTIRALAREGFQCDAASDGNEGLAMANCTHYDVVVTDLKIPNRNGHSLAVELLAQAQHPLLFVLTGVAEARLTNDLLQRGVSQVLIKPIEYSLMAAMVKQRTSEQAGIDSSQVEHVTTAPSEASSRPTEAAGSCQVDATDNLLPAIDQAQFALGMSRISQVMPVSETAINVYRMSQSGEADSREFAHAIVKHKVLATEVIELANLPFYNPNRSRISHVDRGAIQIGQKRIGQYTLAASALAAFIDQKPSPLDTNAIWRKSVAAGIALEMLVKLGAHQNISDGLLMCATLQEVGRVLLASLYPAHYERALLSCVEDGRSIFDIEQATLPKAQNEVMCLALEDWDVPRRIYQPLLHVHENREALALLPEPLRTQTELVKIAGQIAKIASGSWQAWDHVEIPAGDVVDRLAPLALAKIINETRQNVADIHTFGLSPAVSPSTSRTAVPISLAYFEASSARYDFLATVVASMEIQLLPCSKSFDSQRRLLVNCLGLGGKVLPPLIGNNRSSDDVILVCESQFTARYEAYGQVVNVPTSYAALQNALNQGGPCLLRRSGYHRNRRRPQAVTPDVTSGAPHHEKQPSRSVVMLPDFPAF